VVVRGSGIGRDPRGEAPPKCHRSISGEQGVLPSPLGRETGFCERKRHDQAHDADCVRIVHLIRNSLAFVSWKDRKAVAVALKEVYRARTAEAGQAALDAFDEGPWGRKYPVIAQSWRRHWGEVIPFYAFPADVRRIIYTTNAIEAVNAKLRRAVRARGHFPTDDAALKLLFLVLNRVAKEWRMPARERTAAKAQFAILFEDRFTAA
jgi:putative transposase